MKTGINLNALGVTVITCTRRPDALKNILENYNRQLKKEKEMIIILHDNSMDREVWNKAVRKHGNIKVLQMDEKTSLGECLNYGAGRAAFDIIAKFDDDDYYGSRYLLDTIRVLSKKNVEVIGKATSYVYFKKDKVLALRNVGHENRFVHHIDGSTIVFKKSVLEQVRFRDISRGEDKWFCKDCLQKGIRIYSTDRYNHVYMRHANPEDHTWTIQNDELMKWCKVVFKGDIDYDRFINR